MRNILVNIPISGVTRALIGGCIFIYSCSARRISFEMNLISKEIRRAEHEYMNIHPPINALVTPLIPIAPRAISCTEIGGDFFSYIIPRDVNCSCSFSINL